MVVRGKEAQGSRIGTTGKTRARVTSAFTELNEIIILEIKKCPKLMHAGLMGK